MVDELILLFGKIATVGSRKYDYFLGCGVFFLRRPFSLRFIFGFHFHNVYLASQRIISKENRISDNHVISRYGCTERHFAFSFYLVSNAIR